jgi:hypothetical protein
MLPIPAVTGLVGFARELHRTGTGDVRPATMRESAFLAPPAHEGMHSRAKVEVHLA